MQKLNLFQYVIICTFVCIFSIILTVLYNCVLQVTMVIYPANIIQWHFNT